MPRRREPRPPREPAPPADVGPPDPDSPGDVVPSPERHADEAGRPGDIDHPDEVVRPDDEGDVVPAVR